MTHGNKRTMYQLIYELYVAFLRIIPFANSSKRFLFYQNVNTYVLIVASNHKEKNFGAINIIIRLIA